MPRLDASRRGPVTSSLATVEFLQFNLHLAAPPATGGMPLAQLSAREGVRLPVETIQRADEDETVWRDIDKFEGDQALFPQISVDTLVRLDRSSVFPFPSSPPSVAPTPQI